MMNQIKRKWRRHNFSHQKRVYFCFCFFLRQQSSNYKLYRGEGKVDFEWRWAGKRRKTFYLKEKKNESICKKLELTKIAKRNNFLSENKNPDKHFLVFQQQKYSDSFYKMLLVFSNHFKKLNFLLFLTRSSFDRNFFKSFLILASWKPIKNEIKKQQMFSKEEGRNNKKKWRRIKKKSNENLMRCRRERETIEERQFFFVFSFITTGNLENKQLN
jgi:hypothetical protein